MDGRGGLRSRLILTKGVLARVRPLSDLIHLSNSRYNGINPAQRLVRWSKAKVRHKTIAPCCNWLVNASAVCAGTSRRGGLTTFNFPGQGHWCIEDNTGKI